MSDLETRLRALAADAEFPPTPDLAAAVRPRLVTTPPARRRRPSRRLVVALVAAALVLPAAAVAAVPDARNAVLEWLGLRSVEVRRVPAPPRAPAGPSELGLDLGRPVTLAEARDRLRFEILVPALPGRSPRVFVDSSPPGGRVSFLYDRPRLLLTEFRGSRSQTFLEKAVGPDTTIRRVRVGGAPGAWIAGRPHGFVYADANGAIRDDTTRLAGNVLLWERDGLILRLEGARTLAGALRVARSVH